MLIKRNTIPVAEAVSKIMSMSMDGISELVSIEDCHERFLAEEVIATHDVPLFDRSPYDGFAIIAESTAKASNNNPIALEVIEELGAGMLSQCTINNSQAIRLMTGTKMPLGCNAVIMLELVNEHCKDGKKYISIKRKVTKGENISIKGEETKKGDCLIPIGTQINSGVIAVLATFGYEKVKVAKVPTIGIFATGNELLDINEELLDGKIRNSNSYMLCAQIKRAGGKPKYYGKLADDVETSVKAIKDVLEEVDILITTGGVSVGDYDLLPKIYQQLEATILFNKVSMRPGSVTTVASLSNKFLFGLSGNPSACYVGFELFTRPVIRKMLFAKFPHLKLTKAILSEDFPKANPFTRMLRSYTYVDGTIQKTRPTGLDKSNVVMSLAATNSFTILPGGTRGFCQGEEVYVLLLDDQEGSLWPWDKVGYKN